jgi:hypothetical protein
MPENSKKFYKKLCKVAECNVPTKCGKNYGYAWLTSKPNNYFILSSENNMSHDLRLIYILSRIKEIFVSKPDLFAIMKKIIYTEIYGTKEIVYSGLPANINNVKDMERTLRDFVNTNAEKASNDIRYSSRTKLGDLHIYTDMSQPMRYVSSV